MNGILTESGEHTDNVTVLDSLLQNDPGQRFPRSSVLLTGIYNSTYFSSDSSTRIQPACNQAAFAEIRARQLLTEDGMTEDSLTEVANNLVGCLVASHARWLAHAVLSGDFAEMRRWQRAAIRTSPPPDWEVANLANVIRKFRDDSLMHVLLVAHSEGSVLSQLAVQQLKINRRFNEDSASKCIGTVSVAGVGTTNWPLSDRHAKFVVAKWDIVTLLGGGFDNPRETIQDKDTRAVDFFLAGLPPDSTANRLSLMALAFFPKTIHSLQRYLSSTESGPRIANHIDDLYRTCAVGTVTVTPPAVTLQLDGARTFNATWHAVDGLPLTTSDSIAWSVDSTLASVSPHGRVVAGSVPGTVTLQAKVRSTVGTADITIVDDSLRATFTPPIISAVDTRRQFTGMMNGPGPLQTKPPGFLGWYMSISTSAMTGATISKVEVFRRLRGSTGAEFVAYSGPLPEGEIAYQGLQYNGDGTPTPMAFETFANEDFSWYRVVITDSHGLQTAFIGSSADPTMLP